MELVTTNNKIINQVISEKDVIAPINPFIESNTKEVTFEYLKNDCIIPVFSKDMECTLAHHEFIKTTQECVRAIFEGQNISNPEMRVSHKVMGRVPSAISKPVKELLEHEKTQYFERMMFKIDVPSITELVGGNRLCLSLIAVRAYNQENLYSYKSYEKFKIGIGFLNYACTNMCLSSDGLVDELRASSADELKKKIMDLIGSYEMQKHLNTLKRFTEYYLTEKEFAKFLGKCRMYNYLPKSERKEVASLQLNDGQLSTVAKGYYEDENFSRNKDGTISLYNLYNLFTSSIKNSYIDTFLSRSVNSYEIAESLANSMQNQSENWFLN
ncbi:DUF3871 family protein [Flavobacteriaceae bacterium S0862]|nr:DUF3871 family protein [Flavobacteriaceae bacterium S0862]